jgi:hypothetical protein
MEPQVAVKHRARKVKIVRPTTRALAIGFGLAVAVMSSVVWAQRSGGSHRGAGQAAGASQGGGGYRGGSHHGGSGRHSGHRHGGHSHSHGGVFLGFTSPFWFGPYSYPYAYPYYPYESYSYPYYPLVGGSEGPVVYIERTDPDLTWEGSSGYWHYCRESNLYYPYARECAGWWERVPAQPQSAER